MGLREDTWGWLQPALQEMRAATDQSWDQRRAKFVERLGLREAEDHPVVSELLVNKLDKLSDQDRTTLLGSDQLGTTAYELVQTLVREPATAPSAGYDEQAWQALLRTNGARWDGTADSWPAFRQWFEYYATEQRLGSRAKALLDFLETQSPADRIATFAQYGVTITRPAARPTGGDFEWVTGDQATTLTRILGADWQRPLADDLTGRWGQDWRTHPAEHKAAWLADLISSGQLAKAKTDQVPESALAELKALIDSIPDGDDLVIDGLES